MSSVETMPKMLAVRENPVLGSKGPCRLCTREPHSSLSCRGAYSHFVQLFIHIFIIFIVLAQLRDQSPVGEGEELRALKEVQNAIRTKKHKRKCLVSLGQPQCCCQDSKEGHLRLVGKNIIPCGVAKECAPPRVKVAGL